MRGCTATAAWYKFFYGSDGSDVRRRSSNLFDKKERMTGGNRDGEHAAVEKASGTVQRRMTRQSTAALGSEHTGKRRKTAG